MSPRIQRRPPFRRRNHRRAFSANHHVAAHSAPTAKGGGPAAAGRRAFSVRRHVAAHSAPTTMSPRIQRRPPFRRRNQRLPPCHRAFSVGRHSASAASVGRHFVYVPTASGQRGTYTAAVNPGRANLVKERAVLAWVARAGRAALAWVARDPPLGRPRGRRHAGGAMQPHLFRRYM
jgi:hypothetical protein